MSEGHTEVNANILLLEHQDLFLDQILAHARTLRDPHILGTTLDYSMRLSMCPNCFEDTGRMVGIDAPAAFGGALREHGLLQGELPMHARAFFREPHHSLRSVPAERPLVAGLGESSGVTQVDLCLMPYYDAVVRGDYYAAAQRLMTLQTLVPEFHASVIDALHIPAQVQGSLSALHRALEAQLRSTGLISGEAVAHADALRLSATICGIHIG